MNLLHRPPWRAAGPRAAGLFAILAIWVMLLATYLMSTVGGPNFNRANILYTTVAALSGVVFSAAFVFADRFLSAPARTSHRIARLSGLVVVVSLLHSAVDVPLQGWIERLRHNPLDMLALNFIYYFWVHAAAAGLVSLIRVMKELHAAEQRASRLVLEAARAQVDTLRLQINPHFLFNTLNAISSLILTSRPAEAEVVLGRLAALLRLSLNADPGQLCRLDHELALAECYTDVEQARYGDRLSVRFRVDPAAMTAMVPCFLLQPIIEALVAEAMEFGRGVLNLEVTAKRDADALRIEILHDGVTQRTAPSLDALRDRLNLTYDGHASWESGTDEQGFRLALALPSAS